MQFRKDYILERWVAISEKRGMRPKQFKSATELHDDPSKCFFCPGNEHTTPPEVGRVLYEDNTKKWKVRWFENKFPAVSLETKPALDSSSPLFVKDNAYGKHEVIVETDDHQKQLWDLPVDHIKEIIDVYKNRIVELEKIPDMQYVQIFKNHGAQGGTSIIHSHTQVAALHIIPSLIDAESKASFKNNNCVFCKVVHDESFSDRKVYETEQLMSFCPWASRFNYEVWIFPKPHIEKLEQIKSAELADHLIRILEKLKQLNCSYNFFIHYAPKGNNLHMHVEITPRMATWAGFENATDIVINSVPPETAAAFFRGEIKIDG